MKIIGGLSALLLATFASGAMAQEAPSSLTLDGQLQRVQQGQPAIARQAPAPVTEAAPSAGGDNVGGFTRRHADDAQLGSGAIPALPLEVQTSNNISYLTGGIGDEEEAELKMKDRDFNLHVLFTAPGGDYISDVMVRVLDAKAADQSTALLEIPSAGPYLFINLPAGKYVFEATAKEGGIKKLSVKIPAKGIVREQIAFLE